MPVTPCAETLGRTTQNFASASRKRASDLSMRAVTTTSLRSLESVTFSTVPTVTSRKRTEVCPASTPAALRNTMSMSGPRSW